MTGITGIVTGYDGSPGSEEALRWAVREAKDRTTTLTACLAWDPDRLVRENEDDTRRRLEEVLTHGLGDAISQLGSGRVQPVVARGPAARVLCDHGRTAQIVVTGSCGHGELPGGLLGPVAWQVAGHGNGPVVVVRGRWRPVNEAPGPVVVGVDGSTSALAAMSFAFEEAMLRDVPLFAVCAPADTLSVIGGAHQVEEDFSRMMAEQEKEHPDVTVVRHIAPGSPRAALLTAAAEAQLLVVGARGRGGIPGMSLGSVAQVVVHHAACPVAVVHPRAA